MRHLVVAVWALAAVAFHGSPAASACPELAVRVATTPIPPQYPLALGHAEELLQRVPGRADIMIIGDSIMAAWPPDSIARTFPGQAVWNYAVGGDKTQNMLWRTDQLDRRDVTVRKVAILAGTNNLADPDMPACAIAIGVETLAGKAHAIWPDASLYLLTIAPRGENFSFRDDDRREINQLLTEWAARSRYARIVSLPETELTCAGAYRSCPNYEPDLLHFRPGAYEIVGRALRAVVAR